MTRVRKQRRTAPELTGHMFFCSQNLGVCPAGNASAILVASDAEAAEKTAQQLRPGKYGLVWTQFNDLSGFFHDR